MIIPPDGMAERVVALPEQILPGLAVAFIFTTDFSVTVIGTRVVHAFPSVIVQV
jgi:hypothetical protein